MGKAVVLAAVALLGIGLVLWVTYQIGKMVHEVRMQKNGLAGLRGARMLRDAAKVLGNIGVPTISDDLEIINSINRQAIDQWLREYNKERVKGP